MSTARRPDGAPIPPLHRPHQVARILGCSEWWVKEQARRRRIPFTWVGGSYRFTDAHITEIIRIFERRPAEVYVPLAAPRRRRHEAPAAPAAPAAPIRLTARPPARARRASPNTQAI